MLDHVTAGNLDLAGQPQPIIELQDEEDDAGHSGRPGSDHQQSDQLGPDLLNSNGLNSITWYLVFLLRHELNIYSVFDTFYKIELVFGIHISRELKLFGLTHFPRPNIFMTIDIECNFMICQNSI